MNQRHILIVDDSNFIREGLSSAFNQLKHRVSTAQDAAEAYSFFLSDETLDTVIIDIVMPDNTVDQTRSGIELLRKIRFKNSDIPIFMLTAQPSIDQALEAFNLGINAFLLKRNFSLENEQKGNEPSDAFYRLSAQVEFYVAPLNSGASLSQIVNVYEKQLLLTALKMYDGELSRLEEKLNVPISTLKYKLGKHGISSSNRTTTELFLNVSLGSSLAEQIKRFEKEILLKSLNHNRYNQTLTAENLYMDRSTLARKAKKYGIRL